MAGPPVWTEQPDASIAPDGAWTLHAWIAGMPDPRVVAIPPGPGAPVAPYFELVGNTLLYAVYPVGASNEPTSVWRMNLADGTRERLSPNDGSACFPQAGAPGLVFMACGGQYGTQSLVVWREGAGWWALDGIPDPAMVVANGGWVMVMGQSQTTNTILGFRLSDLSPSP